MPSMRSQLKVVSPLEPQEAAEAGQADHCAEFGGCQEGRQLKGQAWATKAQKAKAKKGNCSGCGRLRVAGKSCT
jgi:hypothetical protein